MPEIWWISVVLPAPFGPMMACNSPGSNREADVVGDDERAVSFAQVAQLEQRLSHGRLAASRPMMPPRANSTIRIRSGPKTIFQFSTSRARMSSCSRKPKVMQDFRQEFLQQEEGGRPDDGAMQRAEAAEHDHEDQLAGALPGHVGRADELGLVGEQAAGKPRHHAADRIGGELIAERMEADGFHPDAGSPRVPRRTRPNREATIDPRRARSMARRQTKRQPSRRRHRSSSRAVPGDAAARRQASCRHRRHRMASDVARKNSIWPKARVIMMK